MGALAGENGVITFDGEKVVIDRSRAPMRVGEWLRDEAVIQITELEEVYFKKGSVIMLGHVGFQVAGDRWQKRRKSAALAGQNPLAINFRKSLNRQFKALAEEINEAIAKP